MAWVVAGATLASAAIGAYGSSQNAKAAAKGSQTDNSPWAPQQPYLKKGFEDASYFLDQYGKSRPGYQGQWDAGTNQNLADAQNAQLDWAKGAGFNGGGAMANAGLAGVGNFGQNVSNTNDLYARSMADPTGQTIANAGQYANNPYMDSMVDASLRDVNRNLQMGVAGNNANAVGTGGMNSTRTGVADAMLKTNAADRAADISSTLRGGAYQNGLGLAANQIQQGFSNGLNANAQGLSAAAAGGNMLGTGLNIQNSALGLQNTVGMQQRTIANEGLTADRAAYTYDDNRMLDLIAKYQNIVGGQQYGSQTQATQPYTGPGAAQTGLGAGMQALGMAGQMGWKPFADTPQQQPLAVDPNHYASPIGPGLT